ncbi:MAG TPA: glycosyltransferase family 39 protein [Verrucomicrobiae bacterium]|nr:glycosyltransferase family 39 protein [Verrucomicrobiae bacterium]
MRHRLPVCLLLLLILSFNFAIRWRLRDMPLERDEGEYAYAGQLILQGIPPYQVAVNMKFPGVYFAYSLLMALFGESASGIHVGMILVTSMTTVLVFMIGCRLTSAAGGLFAAATFVCLSALPQALGFAAHATHFVSLFVCAGTLALLIARKKNSSLGWFVSGMAFGLAVLMTQQAVFFPALSLAWCLWEEFRRGSSQKPGLLALAFCGGCAAPFLVMAAGLACAGVWNNFIFWTFDYARRYVSIFPLRAAPGQFAVGFDPILQSGVWVWFLGIIGLIFVFRKRDWSAPMELAGLLFLAGMLGACPGFYFRNHYFLMAMPGLALLNAVALTTVAETLKNTSPALWIKPLPLCLAGFIIGNLLVNNCQIWFVSTPWQISRELYGNSPFPESVPIAEYLRKNTSPNDTIAVLGSEPQIFFLAHRRSASSHIYLYPLTEPQPMAPEMRRQFIGEIEAARPKFVVFVNILSSWYQVILPRDSSQSTNSIPAWWNNYSTNYLLVGAVDISAGKPSQFFWDEQLLDHANSSNDSVLIYRRKK